MCEYQQSNKWIMLTALSLLLIALLSGCSTVEVQHEVREVKIPVSVPCVAPKIEKPIFAVDSLPIGAGIWSQMSALRAERYQHRGYEEKLEAALSICQK